MSTLFQLSESHILSVGIQIFSQKRPHPQSCCLRVVQDRQPVKSSAPEGSTVLLAEIQSYRRRVEMAV